MVLTKWWLIGIDRPKVCQENIIHYFTISASVDCWHKTGWGPWIYAISFSVSLMLTGCFFFFFLEILQPPEWGKNIRSLWYWWSQNWWLMWTFLQVADQNLHDVMHCAATWLHECVGVQVFLIKCSVSVCVHNSYICIKIRFLTFSNGERKRERDVNVHVYLRIVHIFVQETQYTAQHEFYCEHFGQKDKREDRKE